MKKSDCLLFVLALIALGFAGFRYFSSVKTAKPIFHSDTLQIVGVIRDRDCLDCIEKLLCSWDQMVDSVNEDKQREIRLLFFVENLAGFDPNSISAICNTSVQVEFLDMKDYEDQPLAPAFTPAVLLMSQGKVIAQDPIFFTTKMPDLEFRIKERLSHLHALKGY